MTSMIGASTIAASSGLSSRILLVASDCKPFIIVIFCYFVCSCVPYLGMVTIILNDYPKLKNILVLSMAVFTIITRE